MSAAVIADEAIEAMLAKWHRMADHHALRTFQTLPVSLKADLSLLDLALTHLVDNALKFSPAHSTVTVAADRVEDSLVFTVTDEGIGIPAEELPLVCDWLVRGREVASQATYPPGLGMGLYTARRIVEAHGGELRITSTLGKGTQAVVALPVFINNVE
jgi:signal transduction histidine kinase